MALPPITLLPAQQALVDATEPFICFTGPIGSGRTYGGMARALSRAAKPLRTATVIICSSPDRLRAILGQMAALVYDEQEGPVPDAAAVIADKPVSWLLQHSVMHLCTPATYRQLKADLTGIDNLWIDDFASFSYIEWVHLRERVRKSPNGSAWLTGNLLPNSPYRDEFITRRAADHLLITATAS